MDAAESSLQLRAGQSSNGNAQRPWVQAARNGEHTTAKAPAASGRTHGSTHAQGWLYPRFIYTSFFPFLELSRPLARPPGAGRLEVEGFGWAWDRILRRKCGPGPWARARAGPWLGPSISSSIFRAKPIQILQLPASQPLEAALAAD